MSAVDACLETAGVTADDVDAVVFYEKPLAVASRFLAAKQRQGPASARSFFSDAPEVFGRHLMVGYRISRMLRSLGASSPPMARFVEHHLSHAASAFFPSPHAHAGVLTVDGLGEWATATIGRGAAHRIDLIEELRFPDSLGLAYSFITSWCGFRPNCDEYKLMGLATYGEPRFTDALDQVVKPVGDGSLTLDVARLGWFTHDGRESRNNRRLADLLGGPPRDPEAPITCREADLAASIQELTELTILDMAARVHELTDESALCLAGGVALNCVANGRLLREGPFDEVWVQPAAGDAGGAIGAALAYWHMELGMAREVSSVTDAMSGGFLGPAITEDEVDSALKRWELDARRLEPTELVDYAARRLSEGAVLAWCRGRMEFGPRALGHRSILADPRSPTVRQRLNRITKGREDFRPFAPAVLAERAGEWFELDHPSPYMLLVASVRGEHMSEIADEPKDLEARAEIPRSAIPACTHVDGSALVQTVAADENPDLHALLSAFEDVTGCPVLVNTSFNRAGEPIVATADQAIRSAAAGHVDVLVLGDRVVEGVQLEVVAAGAEDRQACAPAVEGRRAAAHGSRNAGPVGRIAVAWAVATVPAVAQFLDIGITSWSALWLASLTLSLLTAASLRNAWVLVPAAVAVLGVLLNPVHPVYVLMVLGAMWLSGSATALLALRRPSLNRPMWVRRASVLPVLPVLVADVILIARPGVLVPAACIAAGVGLVSLGLIWPIAWDGVESRFSRVTDLTSRAVRMTVTVVERTMGAVGRGLGLGVTAVAFLVCVLVPWLLQRLSLADPLAAGHRQGSRWIRRSGGRDLGSADLWFPDPGPRPALLSRPGIRMTGVVVVGILLAVVTRSVMHDDSELTPSSEIPRSAAERDLRAQPWFADWEAAYIEMFDRGEMSQYAGTDFGDVSSAHLNVERGVRRSWRAVDEACTSPVHVWMFGGSTLFGVGARDDHTLPSELARVAWHDGYDLAVSNYAVPGDVAWIENRRLERALAQGAERPDIVVFYDGFNDLRAQSWAYETGRDTRDQFMSLQDRDLLPLLDELAEEEWDGRKAMVADAVDLIVRRVDDEAGLAAVVEGTVFQYGAADRLGRRFLADLGIPMYRFFQPWVNTRDPKVPGDFPSYRIEREKVDLLREELPEGPIDLADVLDGDPNAYFVDDVHTSEAANVPIAVAMWDALKPTVEQLTANDGVGPCT
ncbi:MAG: hypothetical protein M5U19_09610 [Microthrixaceae bacterium]|nr:hypothetical protein [Microthrixaceae bacterium]